MISLVDWFDTEVSRWRTGASITWVVILVLPITVFFSFLATLNLLDLSGSLLHSLRLIVSIWFWFFILIILFALLLQSRFNFRNYRVTSVVHTSHLSALCSHIHPSRLVNIFSHVMVGGVVAWSATKLLVGSGVDQILKLSSTNDASVLNEDHLFVILHGSFTAFIYAVSFYAADGFHLRFPRVQQRRFFQVKSRLIPLVKSSGVQVLKRLLVFFFLYYLLTDRLLRAGVSARLLTSNHVDSSSSTYSSQFNTLYSLLDLRLIWFTWLIGVFVHIIISLPALLYTVYHTAPFSFPIETEFDLYQDKCLYNALACHQRPILQYLACLDLNLLARHSARRRSELFSLTDLGGRPVNWERVFNECLLQLTVFLDRLTTYNDQSIIKPKTATETNTLVESWQSAPAVDVGVGVDMYRGGRVMGRGGIHDGVGRGRMRYLSNGAMPETYKSCQPAAEPLIIDPAKCCPECKSGSFISSVCRTCRSRREIGADCALSPRLSLLGVGRHYVSALQDALGDGRRQRVPGSFADKCRSVFNKWILSLGRRSIVVYFINNRAESISRQLFIDGQKYQWMIEALSHLVAASYAEDTYGVVQKSLPEILTLYLTLLEAIDRHLKVCPVTLRKPHLSNGGGWGGAGGGEGDMWRFSLRAAIRESIYRIVTTFDKNLMSISIGADHARRLASFMDFKE